MQWILGLRGFLVGLLVVAAMGLAGCGKGDTASQSDAGSPDATNVDLTHGGWWCTEHGVPEEECALCDSSLVAKFKEDGDWCDEHSRPESQCFICSPSRFDKFAARYEAKTGRKPPQPEE